MKIAAFFGGAINDTATQEYLDSVEIGRILHENGYIVKNGGYRGLMEAVSKGAASSGGAAHGYVCRSFGSIVGNDHLTKTIVCEDLYDRLRGLIDSADLFVVQRGGIGTLSELFLCLDIIRKKKYFERPKVFLIGNFWKPIFAALVNEGVVSPKDRELVKIINVEDFEQELLPKI